MFSIDRNTIKINDKSVSFKYPIIDTVEIDDLLILLLGVHPRITDFENVYAINQKCEIIWQVNGINYSGEERNSIINMIGKNGRLFVIDDARDWYEVSLVDGSVEKRNPKELRRNHNK